MTLLTKELTSNSPEATEALATAVGQQLKGHETIELSSDLGGGKTTFVRGLAKGFGSTDRVASPTFTISKIYTSGSKAMHHFDFYRLPESGLMSYELADDLDDADTVVVIEWAEVVKHVLPEERVQIAINTTGDQSRKLVIHYPQSLAYLVEGLKT